LGTDTLLVWSTDINSKAPQSSNFFSWHQDSTYAGLTPDDGVLTAWVSLGPCSAYCGCMNFIPQSHHQQLPHAETSDAANSLSLGQTISSEALVSFGAPVLAELAPGQASIHHWRCVHSSNANSSPFERVGLAVRYMAPWVARANTGINSRKEFVTVVCGEYTGSEWETEIPLDEEYGEREWKQHEESMRREKDNYFQDKAVQVFK